MTTPQQDINALVETGMIGVMAVNVIASMIGILATTATVMPIAAGVPATDAGIKDLTQAYGSDIVNRAIKNVGKDDILVLATEVERLVIAQMRKQYGDKSTVAALSAAAPGDLTTAREIARRLAGLPPQMHEVVIQAIETPAAPQTPQVERTVQAIKKRGRQAAQPVKDTKTGVVYKSKASAGMAVASEYGLDSKNHFIWYEVIKKDPKRFVAASQAEAESPKALSFTTEVQESVSGATMTPQSRLQFVQQYLPEYKQVLAESGGYNPRKFIERLEVRLTPSGFNPSAQGDFAFTQSFAWDGKTLSKGPAYSYDTMMTTIESPYERAVDVPVGARVWVTTYDGQWGGFWSRVLVFVNPADTVAKFSALQLPGGGA